MEIDHQNQVFQREIVGVPQDCVNNRKIGMQIRDVDSIDN